MTLLLRRYSRAASAQVSSDQDVQKVAKPSSSVRGLLVVGLVAALLCAPFYRVVLFLGDEGTLLRGAELILHGKRVYADFFQLVPPGTLVATAAWFGIAGVSFGSARLLAVLTYVGIACFTYLACRQASRNSALSAVLAVAWTMMSEWASLQISHHGFATLLSMVVLWAALVSLEEPRRKLLWPAIAGMAAGASGMFIPQVGAFTALAALTAFLGLRRRPAELIAYLLGCALAPVLAIAYLLDQGALAAAFDDVIRFPATGYTSINIVPFGFGADSRNRPLVFVFVLTPLLAVLLFASNWRASLGDRRLRFAGAFAIAGFFECFPRCDVGHIAASVPLVLPLLAFCMIQLTQWWPPAYRYVAAAGAIALCAPSAVHFAGTVRWVLRSEVVATPRGSVRLMGPFVAERGFPELLASIAATPSGDTYFFYPWDAMVAFLTGRKHVSKYDIITPYYTTPVQYQEACRDAVRDASWVVIDLPLDPLDDFLSWKKLLPSMPNVAPQEDVRFREAIDSAFELSSKYGTFELRRRREGASDSVCDRIAEQ
jgi:hypothetical protein